MVVALPIRPKLRVGDDIVSMRLGKAVAMVSASGRPSPLSVTAAQHTESTDIENSAEAAEGKTSQCSY